MDVPDSKQSRPPRWLKFRSSTSYIGVVIFIATFTPSTQSSGGDAHMHAGWIGIRSGDPTSLRAVEPRTDFVKIVPIIPFSIPERSGVPKDDAIAGWFADQGSSRRRSFFSGIALLFASTLLFALGRSPTVLVLARCLQGASAGIVYTVGLALLVDTVGKDQVGVWMGSVLSGMSAGITIGPFIGGIIYARAGHLPVFAVILAAIALDFLLRLFMIEKHSARKWLIEKDYGTFSAQQQYASRSEDHICDQDQQSTEDAHVNTHKPPRIKVVTSSEPSEGRNGQSSEQQAGSREGLTKFAQSTAVLLRSRGILAAMYGGFVQTCLITSFDSILPLFVHRTFGWDSSGGGSIFLAISVPSLAAPVVGIMSDRLGARRVVLAGFGVSMLALTLLSLVGQNTIQHMVLLCALLALTGFGTTMMLSPLAADMCAIVSQLGEDHRSLFGPGGAFAKAYGLFNTALAVGAMVGPALAGLLYEME
ncbi:MAG: hypothetical protein Q9228_004801, partial [Teloschistes exilis]